MEDFTPLIPLGALLKTNFLDKAYILEKDFVVIKT